MKTVSLPLNAILLLCTPLFSSHQSLCSTAVAHHNVVSNRYTEPRPFFMNTTREISKQGFEYEFTINMEDPNAPQNGDFSTIYNVAAPGLVRMVTKLGEEAGHVIEMYVSPAAPGFCNMCTRQVLVKTKDGKVKYTGRETRDRQIKVCLIFQSSSSIIANSHLIHLLLAPRSWAKLAGFLVAYRHE